jgi:hypothetical protein
MNEREKWLDDTAAAFESARSYNGTIITVGYGTGFACLLLLSDKTDSSLVYPDVA